MTTRDDDRLSRRAFLTASGLGVAGAILRGQAPGTAGEPVIDIHQHLGYSGRTDAALLAHQRAMGISLTVLLPAGTPMQTPSTHGGASNGLAAQCLGTDACRAFAAAHPGGYRFAANEVPDAPEATRAIERDLDRGALMIAEQKFGVACDSPAMHRIYSLAAERRVPVLMHWQFERYNHGFERFHTILAKYPGVTFIGHAQTWWANIDAGHRDQSVLYPKGPVTPGGLTDRYLSDYPNMYGDLSAGSGLNALTRDEAFTRDFLERHQDRLLYGSDCSDSEGAGARCQGSQTLAALRRLAPSRAIERKLLFDNAKRLFRL